VRDRFRLVARLARAKTGDAQKHNANPDGLGGKARRGSGSHGQAMPTDLFLRFRRAAKPLQNTLDRLFGFIHNGSFRRKIPMSKISPLLFAIILQACVFTPKTHEIYDEDCKILYGHMVLESTEIKALGNCSGNVECVGLLIGTGLTIAASAIISGSIVVAGNTVYWLEKQGRCIRVSNPAPSARSGSTAPAW
jgi:hypothetical protein